MRLLPTTTDSKLVRERCMQREPVEWVSQDAVCIELIPALLHALESYGEAREVVSRTIRDVVPPSMFFRP